VATTASEIHIRSLHFPPKKYNGPMPLYHLAEPVADIVATSNKIQCYSFKFQKKHFERKPITVIILSPLSTYLFPFPSALHSPFTFPL
jgi:hypothetical protein